MSNEEVRCPNCGKLLARLLNGQAEFRCGPCKKTVTLVRTIDTSWRVMVVSR
jgi:phage FluMu protein Com